MSAGNFRRTARRLVPPIAWRDEKLEERAQEIRQLKKQLRRAARAREDAASVRQDLNEVRASLRRPSFQRMLEDLRRSVVSLRAVDPDKAHPLRQLPFKLRNYRLAASHGIAVPEVYAAWSTIEEISLAELPDEFVVKSDGGAGGHGVLPLRRRADGLFELVSTDQVMTEADVRARLGSVRSLSGPFFAEELLRGVNGRRIPEDVKLYGFYGDIGQVLLRRVQEHGNLLTTSYRFVDELGADLGDGAWDKRLDPTIALPAQFIGMVEATRHLSLAVGVPFVRVDVYETDRGVVLGEFTRVPGGSPRYSREHDELMGRLYEDARWRVERDIMAGRPPGILHGTHDAPNSYPATHVSQRDDPGTWAVTRAACEWCANEPDALPRTGQRPGAQAPRR